MGIFLFFDIWHALGIPTFYHISSVKEESFLSQFGSNFQQGLVCGSVLLEFGVTMIHVPVSIALHVLAGEVISIVGVGAEHAKLLGIPGIPNSTLNSAS